ncbi:MAG TPA: hypothetical protein VJV79_21660 [Polyangiaceae bacterium]|nr:hypothetical protein [Polyangiaceae bacterium]
MGSSYQAIRRNLARLLPLRGLGTVVIALSAWSCQASVNADAKTHVRHDAEEGPEDAPDFDKPISAKALAASPAAAPSFGTPTLLGARHDMSLVVEHANAACTCVKVAIGSAPSAAFKWQASVPRLNDDTQLAIALSSETMPCKNEPKGSSGASYWGYRISGNDVIVFVEGARAGRPRTGAAIIPKPVADGQIYVAPAKSKLPYGLPLDGSRAKCKIGNVATKRLTPFTASELGDTVLRDPDAVPSVDTGD